MEINKFQEVSKRTFNFDLSIHKQILNCCLGLHGETGEVSDIIKKSFFQGHELDLNHVIEELGDVMFYIVNLCTVLNIDVRDVLKGNYDKLNKRYPNGFSVEDSINRKV